MATEFKSINVHHTGNLTANNAKVYMAFNDKSKHCNIKDGAIIFYCQYANRSQLPINSQIASRLLATEIYPVLMPFRDNVSAMETEIFTDINVSNDIELKPDIAPVSSNKKFYSIVNGTPRLIKNEDNSVYMAWTGLKQFSGMENFGVYVRSRWDTTTVSQQFDPTVALDFRLDVRYFVSNGSPNAEQFRRRHTKGRRPPVA